MINRRTKTLCNFLVVLFTELPFRLLLRTKAYCTEQETYIKKVYFLALLFFASEVFKE